MALILIYTGDGKGKTSAGIGQIIRALGHGARCKVAQFIKQSPEVLDSGEVRILRRLGVEFTSWGAGFSWIEGNDAKNKALAQQGWQRVKDWIEEQSCDMILLDEFTYTLKFGYLDLDSVLDYLGQRHHQEGFPHLVITGRDAPHSLIEEADMVSSIDQIKHHLYDSERTFEPMIEF